jgi:PAS domain S-box-containing protein
MQDLKLAQYKHYGEVSLLEAARQHWRWVLAVAVLLTLLLLVVIYTSYLNRLNRETTRSLQDEIKQKAIAEQELKAKNQRIQESEQRLAAILENILEAVVTIDQRGCIQTFNHAAETMFGFRQDEVLGASVSMLMPPSDAEYHQSYVKDYLQNGDAKVIGIGRETEGLRNNGDVFPLELAVSELAVQGRRMFVGIMRDLTEKKAHETRQRQVEKLEAVSQMAGGFAHEFNNHLSSIVGYTDMLLLDVGDNKELASDLGRVMDAAVRAKILVKQLLDISRSDYEDALVLVPQKIIEDVVVLLRGLLPEGADLHYEPLRDECQIRLSPFQFQQIVLNLGMNAIEALKEGGRIDISLKCIELSEAAAGQEGLGAGDYTLLTVCDDGAGMTPEQMQHIFEASAHAHDQVKEQVVGLAAIKEVVTRNGGVIEVESEPGQGACFKVYLPCSIT